VLNTDLFRDFEVDFLPSNEPYPSSATKFKPEAVNTIINCTPHATLSQLEALKGHARDFQAFSPNAMLEKQWKRRIDPIVHAEVLLHDWLSRTPGGVQQARFFSSTSFATTLFAGPPATKTNEIPIDVPSLSRTWLDWNPRLKRSSCPRGLGDELAHGLATETGSVKRECPVGSSEMIWEQIKGLRGKTPFA